MVQAWRDDMAETITRERHLDLRANPRLDAAGVGKVRTMRSALVLNASFEPLSVVSAQRATCLVLAEKADVLEDDGRVHPLRRR